MDSPLADLRKLSRHFLTIKNQNYHRYFIKSHPVLHRLAIIIGQRGVGKTTTLIQYLLSHANANHLDDRILYVQTDHFLVGRLSLYEIAEKFALDGGQVLAFDEIHKYENWSIELKSIYDTFPELTIIASGSSALKIHQGTHDLSRRAIVYELAGLSFREYCELSLDIVLAPFTLDDILHHHISIVDKIISQLKQINVRVLPYFSRYCQAGYFPYFQEMQSQAEYWITLEQNHHITLESDLVSIHPELSGNSIKKLKHLLQFIAQHVPLKPNWNTIKNVISIGDIRTAKNYFNYLEDANLIRVIPKLSNKLDKISQAEKLLLNNTNQMYAVAQMNQNKGTLRETFFANSVSCMHNLAVPERGDFIIDETVTIEVGGRKKDFNQIKNVNNAYLVRDDIEMGTEARIPLWLFGFLY